MSNYQQKNIFDYGSSKTKDTFNNKKKEAKLRIRITFICNKWAIQLKTLFFYKKKIKNFIYYQKKLKTLLDHVYGSFFLVNIYVCGS